MTALRQASEVALLLSDLDRFEQPLFSRSKVLAKFRGKTQKVVDARHAKLVSLSLGDLEGLAVPLVGSVAIASPVGDCPKLIIRLKNIVAARLLIKLGRFEKLHLGFGQIASTEGFDPLLVAGRRGCLVFAAAGDIAHCLVLSGALRKHEM